MTRAAPPLAACANRRTLPARDRARSAPRRRRWSLLRSRLGRPRLEPGHGGGRGGFPGGAESSPVPVAARGVYIPGRGQRDEAAPIRAGCALLFARSLAPASAPPGPRRRPRSLGKSQPAQALAGRRVGNEVSMSMQLQLWPKRNETLPMTVLCLPAPSPEAPAPLLPRANRIVLPAVSSCSDKPCLTVQKRRPSDRNAISTSLPCDLHHPCSLIPSGGKYLGKREEKHSAVSDLQEQRLQLQPSSTVRLEMRMLGLRPRSYESGIQGMSPVQSFTAPQKSLYSLKLVNR
eukprot:XP_017454488.1 PREDICTED: uncharacterized protein LOC102548111 isoform X2 [Rattus norvegicus]